MKSVNKISASGKMNENENRARTILLERVQNNLNNVESGDEIKILIFQSTDPCADEL